MYADSQLRAAVRKNAATNKGNLFLYDRGLWSLCRHPNYFGEIMFWFGLSLFSVAVGVKVTWTQLIGPIGIFCIILFGCWFLESLSYDKLGNLNILIAQI